jgi:PTS system N-acetylglucosamine-specific IIC component
MDIKTPGREEDYVAAPARIKGAAKNSKGNEKTLKYQKMAEEILAAIGIDNFESIDNCATRLRLELKDNTKVDLKRIKDSGVFGTKSLGTKSLQIIVGPDVEHVADILHDLTKK